MIGNVVNVAVAANRIQVVVLVELGTTENTDIETLQLFPRSDNPSEISNFLRFLFDECSALFHELTLQALVNVLLECNQILSQGRVGVKDSVVAAKFLDHSVSHPASHAKWSEISCMISQCGSDWESSVIGHKELGILHDNFRVIFKLFQRALGKCFR